MRRPRVFGQARFAVVAAIGFVVGAAAAANWPATLRPHPNPTHPGVPQLLCAGGLQPDLETELTPVRTIRASTGETLEIAFSLTSRFGASATARYVLEILDDRGVAQITPVTSPMIGFSTTMTAVTATTSTPTRLPDGFYMVRLTAAAVSGAREATQFSHLYFEVSAGNIYLLDYAEWFERSAVHEGVQA